jgi:hypothetical protein
VACGVEYVCRVALTLILLVSNVFASVERRTHLCSEVLRLRCVIACGFVERAGSSVVFKRVSWYQGMCMVSSEEMAEFRCECGAVKDR